MQHCHCMPTYVFYAKNIKTRNVALDLCTTFFYAVFKHHSPFLVARMSSPPGCTHVCYIRNFVDQCRTTQDSTTELNIPQSVHTFLGDLLIQSESNILTRRKEFARFQSNHENCQKSKSVESPNMPLKLSVRL